MSNVILIILLVMVSIVFLFLLVIIFGWRSLLQMMVRKLNTVFTDSYQENIMEIIPGFRHMGVQNVLENNLRAESGDLLHRPLGSSKKWPHLDEITFIPAQTSPFPISGEEEIDVKVTIGPKAKKPLEIAIPMMISGMAYGISVSEDVRLALVEAAKSAGTAINSGEGGVLPEEFQKAGKYILQFSKTEWGKEEELIRRADMIEIKLGQGALMGMGGKISPKNLSARARQVMGLQADEDGMIYEHFFENQRLEDLKDLVDELRSMTGGVPIGAKIGAGGRIEEDIDHLMEIGVDFITIDGGQAASYGAPPLLADDFGIPTLHAVVRAANHLEKRNKKGEISLIVSGGLLNPGHFLKVLALGADAVYLGSAMLFSVAHRHSIKPLPFEPPTQIVWDNGKWKDQFDRREGAKSAEKFLAASTEEIRTALRAMGKRSLQELSRKDLVSYDWLTAKMIGIPFSFQPWDENDESKNQKEVFQKTNQSPNNP